jgi:DNA-directed RNA polymerase specialized sigma subunit
MTIRPDVAVIDLLIKKAGLEDYTEDSFSIQPWMTPPSFTDPNRLGLAATKDLKKTQKKELELWHNWNNNGRKTEDLQPIYQSFKPMLNKAVASWAGRVEAVPNSAIQAEMHKQFVTAIKTYNPTKAQLNTWVTNNLRKAGRYIKNYQNIGHIPETQIDKIEPYKKAKMELYDKLGYEPDTATIAEHMGQPLRKIQQLEKENRQDLAASKFNEGDPAEILQPKELEALTLIQYDLTPEQRTVYEYTFGMNGKPMLKPGEIANKTNIHASKVSRIRKMLKDKITEAMDVL